MTHSKDRRHFLKSAAVAAAAPMIVPSSVFGRTAPSNRVNLAAIGVGGRGSSNVWHDFVATQDDVRLVAACDCFASRRTDFAARVDEHYGGTYCEPTADWRDVLARDDVDGVHHQHARPLARSAGLSRGRGEEGHVRREAPGRRHGLGLGAAEGRRQERRRLPVRDPAALLERVHAGGGARPQRLHREGPPRRRLVLRTSRAPGDYARVFEERFGPPSPPPCPPTSTTSTWIGPAPMRPYTRSRCSEWGAYHIYDYALGFIAGWGAHPLDIAQWGLGHGPHEPGVLRRHGRDPRRGPLRHRRQLGRALPLRERRDPALHVRPGGDGDAGADGRPQEAPVPGPRDDLLGGGRLGQRQPRLPLRPSQGAPEDPGP